MYYFLETFGHLPLRPTASHLGWNTLTSLTRDSELFKVNHQPAPYSESPVNSDKLINGGIDYGICSAEEKIDVIPVERRKA